jgi:hypothetical protein
VLEELSMFWTRKEPRLTFVVGPFAAMRSPPRAHSPLGYHPYPVCPPEEVSIIMQMTDVQAVAVAVSAADARGNPVPLTALASPVWSVDNPNVLGLAPSADGTSCVCSPALRFG